MTTSSHPTQTSPEGPRRFWRPVNIVVFSVLGLVVLGILYFVYANIRPPLRIDPAHQQCAVDDDCVMAATQCSCDCGTPINKNYAEHYSDKLENRCRGYAGPLCDMACNFKVWCDQGTCAAQDVEPVNHEISQIELIVTAPYSKETIRLDRSGQVYYFAENRMADTEVTDDTRIETTDYVALADYIVDSDFFRLDEQYIDRQIMDGTLYSVTVYRQNVIKPTRVVCNSSCPESAVYIRKKILELWGGELLNIGV